MKMKEVSWREYKCRHGQGAACCIYLVTDGAIFHCNKKHLSPAEFKSLLGARGVIVDCEGVKDLPAMEANIKKAYTTARTLKVMWKWKWALRHLYRKLFVYTKKIAIVNKTTEHGKE